MTTDGQQMEIKHKKKKLPLTSLIGIIGLGVLVLGLVISLVWQKRPRNVQEAEILFAGTMNDADCTILISGKHCVIIDTGEVDDGEHIAELLESRDVEQIDYLVLTHPDKDHIGGADEILNRFSVKHVITPYYGQYSATYSALISRIEQDKIERSILREVTELSCGDFSLLFYPPEKKFYNDDNEYSLVTLVTHGNVKLLLAADIEKERISELGSVSFSGVDLLKVPYHGRSSNAAADFIRRISPRIAIVNAAAPESKIQKTLSKLGVEVYCTNGADWDFFSDGNTLRLNEA